MPGMHSVKTTKKPMEALKDRNHLIKTKPNNAINIILQKCVFGVLCVTLLLRTDNRGSKCWRLCVQLDIRFSDCTWIGQDKGFLRF